MAVKKGYYALAKRDLDRGGESVMVVSELPVEWEVINRIAVERDRLELADWPSSPIRYFPVELTSEEVAELGLGAEVPKQPREPRHLGILAVIGVAVKRWCMRGAKPR